MNDDYRQLSPKAKTAMYVSNVIKFAIILAIAIVCYVAMKDCDWFGVGYAALIVLIVAVFAVYFVAGPIVFYRFYRYLINEEKIDVRRGIIIKKRVVVPIERMHQVELSRGPILSMVGLSNVTIVTAGGTAVIEYLELPVAEKIVEDLNDRVNGIIRGRVSE